ncbi:MAG: hypothetical protein AAGD43_02600 [Pseudomonadota bacterium]
MAKKQEVQCYWDADDREYGHSDPWEIVEHKEPGVISTIEHVAVVGVTFEAYLHPAEDSDTDDEFHVVEDTYEAAEAAIAKERMRRDAIQESSDD